MDDIPRRWVFQSQPLWKPSGLCSSIRLAKLTVSYKTGGKFFEMGNSQSGVAISIEIIPKKKRATGFALWLPGLKCFFDTI